MEWTGERVIPKKMDKDNLVLKDHLTRYKFAKKYCKDKSVLDASCGSGYGAEILNAKSYLGIDNSQEAIEYAQANYKGSFQIYDLETDFPGADFDTCISFETIEHLNNPNNFLNSVASRCKQFICSIPLDCPSPFHKQVYSETQAKELLKPYFKSVDWFYQTVGGKITQNKSGAKFLICIGI